MVISELNLQHFRWEPPKAHLALTVPGKRRAGSFKLGFDELLITERGLWCWLDGERDWATAGGMGRGSFGRISGIKGQMESPLGMWTWSPLKADSWSKKQLAGGFEQGVSHATAGLAGGVWTRMTSVLKHHLAKAAEELKQSEALRGKTFIWSCGKLWKLRLCFTKINVFNQTCFFLNFFCLARSERPNT